MKNSDAIIKMIGGLSVSESAIEAISLITYTHNSLFRCGFPVFPRPVAVIGPRRTKHRRITIRSALSDGGDIVLDKDFEFEPSFGDYLKAMESVKTDRDSNKIPRKQKSSKKIIHEEEKGTDDVGIAVRENSRKRVPYKNGAFVRDDSRNGGFREEIASEKIKKKQNLSVNNSLTRKRSDSSESKHLDLERAAFRSLDNDDDFVDKPRVSKVDMEERIQKLAKW